YCRCTTFITDGYDRNVRDILILFNFFFSSRRRHTRLQGDWSSDVCSSDLLHRARLSRDHYATDREEGRRGGGDDLPPFHEQAALLQRAVPHGGSLGGTTREGRRRPQGGTAREARRARPRARDGGGARGGRRPAVLHPKPRGPVGRGESQDRA